MKIKIVIKIEQCLSLDTWDELSAETIPPVPIFPYYVASDEADYYPHDYNSGGIFKNTPRLCGWKTKYRVSIDREYIPKEKEWLIANILDFIKKYKARQIKEIDIAKKRKAREIKEVIMVEL